MDLLFELYEVRSTGVIETNQWSLCEWLWLIDGLIKAFGFLRFVIFSVKRLSTCLFLFILSDWLPYSAPITSTWPRLRCVVGLEEEEY